MESNSGFYTGELLLQNGRDMTRHGEDVEAKVVLLLFLYKVLIITHYF